jgi:hypothetical protein
MARLFQTALLLIVATHFYEQADAVQCYRELLVLIDDTYLFPVPENWRPHHLRAPVGVLLHASTSSIEELPAQYGVVVVVQLVVQVWPM